MSSLNRLTVLAAGAAAVAAVLSVPASAAAQAAAPAEPLVTTGDVVHTGDLDLLEDVLEHISMPFGHEGTLTHQLYDSRGADAG